MTEIQDLQRLLDRITAELQTLTAAVPSGFLETYRQDRRRAHLERERLRITIQLELERANIQANY